LARGRPPFPARRSSDLVADGALHHDTQQRSLAGRKLRIGSFRGACHWAAGLCLRRGRLRRARRRATVRNLVEQRRDPVGIELLLLLGFRRLALLLGKSLAPLLPLLGLLGLSLRLGPLLSLLSLSLCLGPLLSLLSLSLCLGTLPGLLRLLPLGGLAGLFRLACFLGLARLLGLAGRFRLLPFDLLGARSLRLRCRQLGYLLGNGVLLGRRLCRLFRRGRRRWRRRGGLELGFRFFLLERLFLAFRLLGLELLGVAIALRQPDDVLRRHQRDLHG